MKIGWEGTDNIPVKFCLICDVALTFNTKQFCAIIGRLPKCFGETRKMHVAIIADSIQLIKSRLQLYNAVSCLITVDAFKFN